MSRSELVEFKAHISFKLPVAVNTDGDLIDEEYDKALDQVWESLERAILNDCRGQDLDIEQK
jgi:hypothetical protein